MKIKQYTINLNLLEIKMHYNEMVHYVSQLPF